MTAPRIIPTTFPLPHAHRMELPTWIAEKLREAFELGRRPTSDMAEANAVYSALGKAGPVWIGYDPGQDGQQRNLVMMPARRGGKVAAIQVLHEHRPLDPNWVKTWPFPGGPR